MNHRIFLTFDENYFDYAKVCIRSIKQNYSNHPPILIYYHGNNQLIQNIIDEFDDVELLNLSFPKEKFNDLNVGVVGSPMIYNRFLLWEKYFQQFDTIVYLDIDVIVLKPFPELFESDKLFAVSDFSEENVFKTNSDKDMLTKLALEDGFDIDIIDKYMINSGVMSIPKKYRSQENHDQIWMLTKKYNEFTRHSDQSILTIWMFLNMIEISTNFYYNFQIHHIVRPNIVEIDIESIKILHFAQWKPNKNMDRFQKRISYAKEFITKAITVYEKYSQIH